MGAGELLTPNNSVWLIEIIHNTKKTLTTKPNETKLALVQVLLRHPARKRIGPILQQSPGPTPARQVSRTETITKEDIVR